MKKVLVLGGGGFIGGHLSKKLKSEGNFVKIIDLKEKHEYFPLVDICDEYVSDDLTDPNSISLDGFDEVYQLAADMGGAGYIFTGENDANLMHNSSLINLNLLKKCVGSKVSKIFYSSSACIYPFNSLSYNEMSAYPANPDSEYGWEKLFSERLYLAFAKNYKLNIRIARFHNIFGPQGAWKGGKEKSPAAICRKVAEANHEIEIWGDGKQTRSFLFVDNCIEAILLLMNSNMTEPVNIGSEEVISINGLAELIISISGKSVKINNIFGKEFVEKYGFECPLGVKDRTSNNKLFFEKVGTYKISPLVEGIKKTYNWINELI